jgi:hypothetical protein
MRKLMFNDMVCNSLVAMFNMHLLPPSSVLILDYLGASCAEVFVVFLSPSRQLLYVEIELQLPPSQSFPIHHSFFVCISMTRLHWALLIS